MITFSVTAGIVLIALIAGAALFRSNEKHTWNNGFCLLSGQPWRLVDVDSIGARMYSDGQGNYCHISWNVDVYK